MSLKNKAVLVTGGAGFIGSHLVDDLLKNEVEKVVVVDNLFLGKDSNIADAKKTYDNFKFYNEDSSNYEKMDRIFRSENIDVVFNLSVIPLPTSLIKPRWTIDMNIDITTAMVELQREEAFETLIHCSSSEAYGSAISVPMSEEHPLNPTTPYAASKLACDFIVLSYYRTFGSDVAIIRPFNNYGPRQNERAFAGIIPTTIKRILDGQPPVIFGDGTQTRDYIYVSDTADAMIEVYKSKNSRGRILNIGSGKEITVKDLIGIISRLLNSDKVPIYKEPRKGDVLRHCADISLAKNIINFKPKTSFEKGILKTVAWYKELMGGK
jgi:UDP-glucose 4-epimerase